MSIEQKSVASVSLYKAKGKQQCRRRKKSDTGENTDRKRNELFSFREKYKGKMEKEYLVEEENFYSHKNCNCLEKLRITGYGLEIRLIV